MDARLRERLARSLGVPGVDRNRERRASNRRREERERASGDVRGQTADVPAVRQDEPTRGKCRMNIHDRDGDNHDPLDVADFLDGLADRSDQATGESLHDSADVVRRLRYLLLTATTRTTSHLQDCDEPMRLPKPCSFCGKYGPHRSGPEDRFHHVVLAADGSWPE